jgi:hypothetical protein
LPVNQRRLGSAQRVRAELEWVEADAGTPLADETGVLTCREATIVAATGEQKFAGLPASHSEILVDRLSRLLGELEPDRTTGLLLADRCSIKRGAVGGHVTDVHSHDIVAAQFAVDGEVEQREIADAPFELQLRPDRPRRGLFVMAASHRSACPCSTAGGGVDYWTGWLPCRS